MDEVDTTEATAAYMKVSPRTLADWRQRGVGPPHVQLNGVVRYRRDDVDGWTKDNKVTIADVSES